MEGKNMMNKIKYVIIFVIVLLLANGCVVETQGDGNKVTLHMIVDNTYFNLPIASKTFEMQPGEDLSDEKIYYLAEQIIGKEAVGKGYKLYLNGNFIKEYNSYTYEENSNDEIYISYDYLKTANLKVDEYKKIEENRDYLVVFHKEYFINFEGIVLKYNNCLVMEDPTGITLIKQIDDLNINSDQIIEFMSYFYQKLYVKPLLLDSGMSPYILDGPFSKGENYKVQVLSNFSYNIYTKSDVRNYLIDGNVINSIYKITKDVEYFQVFAEE
jgi:hypothetical protein